MGQYSIFPPTPKPMDIPPPVQMSRSPSPVIAQPVLDAVMLTIERPHKPMIQLSGKRRNGDSRVTVVGQDTHADALETDARVAVVKKTRLVEQLDLTTRKIINEKDQKIVELQTQV
jgi:hypothetical protein